MQLMRSGFADARRSGMEVAESSRRESSSSNERMPRRPVGFLTNIMFLAQGVVRRTAIIRQAAEDQVSAPQTTDLVGKSGNRTLNRRGLRRIISHGKPSQNLVFCCAACALIRCDVRSLMAGPFAGLFSGWPVYWLAYLLAGLLSGWRISWLASRDELHTK